MPSGIYPRTKEHNKNLSRSLRISLNKPIVRKHMSESRKKSITVKNLFEKLRIKFKGRHFSRSTEFKKGQISVNKGKKFPNRRRNNHPSWKGGRFIDRGYVMIYKPEHPFCISNGYIFEHRLIMEKKLGRYLKPEERVHHVNKNRADNRPINLKLFDSNSKHAHHHYPKGSLLGKNIKA